MHRNEGIHLKWEKFPKIVHYGLYVHFAFPVLVLYHRKLLSRLPGIYFYTPYLPGTYFAIKSYLSPLPGIYFCTPWLLGTYFTVEKFRVCVLQLPCIEDLGLSLLAAEHADTAFSLISPWLSSHLQHSGHPNSLKINDSISISTSL